ncbi:MAG TPA: hypothetical protein VF017_15535 [Thermoanaerobaculia bacterium]|nr:hypothetical protein [Thermoanaerobaculia bacterium]
MASPATGSRVIWGLGLELEPGIPGGTALEFFNPVLPLEANLVSEEAPSKAVNRSGFLEPGTPGDKTGKISFADRFTVTRILPFLWGLFGIVTKTNPVAGVYRYVFEPGLDGPGLAASFWSYGALPPQERGYGSFIRFDELKLDLKSGGELVAALKGYRGHGSRSGLAVADAGNTGTYSLGPWLRGPVASTAGSIAVQVTQVVGGLQFKTFQGAGAPAFTGAAHDVYLDPVSGRGAWQILVDEAGLDVGLVGENYDPCQIVWPGAPADHADLDVGDVFTFEPEQASDPATTVLAGRRFTTAHLQAFQRAIGAPDWVPLQGLEGELMIQNKIEAVSTFGTRYYGRLDRNGLFEAGVKVKRRYTDRTFVDTADRHERLQLRLLFEGQQLTAAYREGLDFVFGSAMVGSPKRDPKDQKLVDEEIELTAETDGAGSHPLTATVTTARDWTPPA